MDVIRLSIGQQAELFGIAPEAIVEAIVATGGAMAFDISPEVIGEISKVFPAFEKVVRPGMAVAMSPDFFSADFFSPEEIEAIRLHEEGHIVLGHLGDRGDLPELEKELEADAYASARVGRPVVVSALLKVGDSMPIFARRWGYDLDEEDYREGFVAAMWARIAALKFNNFSV